MQSLLSDRIRCWKEPILVSYLFLGLLLKRRPGLHTPFPNAWSKKQNIPSSTWPGGHISYAESKHIYCSFISIYHKLSLLRQADAKPQFASKVSSLDVANSPRSLSHVTQPLKTSLVTLPPLQTVARRGPHRHLAPVVLGSKNNLLMPVPVWSLAKYMTKPWLLFREGVFSLCRV